MSGRLTIWIGGREALPVRAIPYVTGWRYSPDVVAESFAQATAAPFGKLRNLAAYHRPAETPLQALACEWTAVVAQVKGFEAELHELRPQIEAIDDHVGIAAWERGAALKLPAGVFVWLDEFLREREADHKRTPDDRPVILAPMLDADTRAAILEGFEDCPRRGPDADLAMIGYADLVAICHVDNPANFGGFRADANGLYVDLPPADATLAQEERAAVTCHPTRQHDKFELHLPSTLAQLRAFLLGAGMAGCIDEEAVDALFSEREHMTGWYDATLDADMWFGLASPTPREAAMVLYQLNPHDDTCDPTKITTDETKPEDFKRLLRVFEDLEKVEPKARTLRQWLAVARDKGLKYHSWIDAYALAQIEGLAADAGSGSKVPKVGTGATAVEISDIPGKLPRIAIGKLAVTAAWQIECESNRAATAYKVIERLQLWADDVKYPETLLRAERRKRAVIWVTIKSQEKEYDVGACGKTLAVWRKSRA